MTKETGIRKTTKRLEVLSPLQLSNFDTSIVLRQVIAIVPRSITELRTLDDNLRELHARAGVNVIDEDMNASTKTKHQSSVFPVKNQVPASQKDLCWGGDGGGSISRRHV